MTRMRPCRLQVNGCLAASLEPFPADLGAQRRLQMFEIC